MHSPMDIDAFLVPQSTISSTSSRSVSTPNFLMFSTTEGNGTGPASGGGSSQQDIDLGLTPELKRVTEAFAAIQNEQLRYKQLLYMAQNTKEANSLPDSSKIPANKVPGCLSTVYVDGTALYDAEVGDYVINFLGDSDGLLTKGLVALLVR
jgi:hypothetical protein